MKKFLLTAVFVLSATVVFAQERIAVFPFEDRDNVLTRNEMAMFYQEFSIAFTNRMPDRSVIPRLEVDRLITTEMDFQLTVFSAQEKTAEMMRVQNATQILSGTIGRLGNNLRISVSLYTYPELVQLPGGAVLSAANKDELFNKIPELVESMYNAIAGSTTTIPPNFVRIQGGTFFMGSPSNEPQRYSVEGPQHQVTVNSFYMSRYEVTQREWYEVMGTTAWRNFGPIKGEGDNYPVYYVSWYDAIEYCNRRSEREGLTPAYTIDRNRSDQNNLVVIDRSVNDTVRWLITWNRNANGYRLPTEAEWEYACRAGTVTPFNTGNNITTSLANYAGNYPYNMTTAVGSFAPNPWGLYDMHGNVFEWCWDWYGDYSSGAQTNPQGAVSGSYRVMRGGSWLRPEQNIRSAYRHGDFPDAKMLYTPDDYASYGFRLVRNAQ
jgi:formylglycine-generating enzyme required for sulfatase activity